MLRRQMVALLPRLRRFAINLTGDQDQGDELVQQGCERALQRFSQFRDNTRIDSWLYKIIHTQWIDRLRRQKTRENHVRQQQSTSGQLVNLPSRRLDATIDIRQAMSTLADDHRAAISLVVIEGYTYNEAAQVLEVPAGTVASRVARARQELAQILKRGKKNRATYKVKASAGGTRR